MTTSADRSLLVSEGFFLAVLSASAYTHAYLYERGFARAFGIPADLIDLRWTTFFGAGVSVLIVAATLGLFFTIALRVDRKKPRLRKAVSVFSPVVVFVVTAALVMGVGRWRILIGIFLISIVASIMTEFPPFARKAPADDEPETSFVRGLRHLPKWALVAPVVFLISLPVAFIAGFVKAIDTKYFLTTGSAPLSAVVRAYGDKLVTAQYDSVAKALIPVYRILPLTDSARVFRLAYLPNVVPVCAPVSKPDERPIGPKTLRRYFGEEAASFQERCERYRLLQTVKTR